MTVHELSASLRTAEGKGGAHRDRRKGLIPAVVYGAGQEPTAIALNNNQFTDFLKRHNYTTSLFRLSVPGADSLAKSVVMIRELQMHHIERTPLSVGFHIVDMGKPVNVVVPIIFEGDAKGIKNGGLVQHVNREIELSSLPDKIPSAIHCNVTELDAGTTWFASELKLSEGVSLAVPGDTPIVSCVITKEKETAAAPAADAAEPAADAKSS